jgi:hypothetical protein
MFGPFPITGTVTAVTVTPENEKFYNLKNVV